MTDISPQVIGSDVASDRFQVRLFKRSRPTHLNLPRIESLAMPEPVSVSGRVRNLNEHGHVNKVSYFPLP